MLQLVKLKSTCRCMSWEDDDDNSKCDYLLE